MIFIYHVIQKKLDYKQLFGKITKEMAGWIGLQQLEVSKLIEVSDGMVKQFWGEGIGFETALFWLKYGFDKLGLEKIVAFADKDNIGSWKIMEKLRIKFQNTEIHYLMECLVFSISKYKIQQIHSTQIFSKKNMKIL